MSSPTNIEKDKASESAHASPEGLKTTDHGTEPAPEILVSKDGLKLFPQPVQGDSLDPLNWSTLQKHSILAIVMALYVAAFNF